jgi:muramoyltetrapeptide carboxypeptidase
MMMALKRAGKLDGLAGLIVGGMTDMKDNKVRFNKTAEEIISEAVKEYSYPVFYGFPAGHIPDNRALIFGREVTLKVDGDSEIIFSNE